MIKKNIFNINLDPVSDEDDGSTGGDFSELTDVTNSIITLDKEDKELINLLDQLMRENNVTDTAHYSSSLGRQRIAHFLPFTMLL